MPAECLEKMTFQAKGVASAESLLLGGGVTEVEKRLSEGEVTRSTDFDRGLGGQGFE